MINTKKLFYTCDNEYNILENINHFYFLFSKSSEIRWIIQ